MYIHGDTPPSKGVGALPDCLERGMGGCVGDLLAAAAGKVRSTDLRRGGGSSPFHVVCSGASSGKLAFMFCMRAPRHSSMSVMTTCAAPPSVHVKAHMHHTLDLDVWQSGEDPRPATFHTSTCGDKGKAFIHPHIIFPHVPNRGKTIIRPHVTYPRVAIRMGPHSAACHTSTCGYLMASMCSHQSTRSTLSCPGRKRLCLHKAPFQSVTERVDGSSCTPNTG